MGQQQRPVMSFIWVSKSSFALNDYKLFQVIFILVEKILSCAGLKPMLCAFVIVTINIGASVTIKHLATSSFISC